MDPRHRELAEIALRAAGSHGLALAGGYAVREHGMGHRPSGDVDLFTDWQRRADFPAAADLVIQALTDNGFVVHVDARAGTFARLLVSRPEPDAEPQKRSYGKSVARNLYRLRASICLYFEHDCHSVH